MEYIMWVLSGRAKSWGAPHSVIIMENFISKNMKRFFGIMPPSEVKTEKVYANKDGFKIIIQAGEKGWTILYADGLTDYKDEVDTTENNFNKAFEIVKKYFKDISEVPSDSY